MEILHLVENRKNMMLHLIFFRMLFLNFKELIFYVFRVIMIAILVLWIQ